MITDVDMKKLEKVFATKQELFELKDDLVTRLDAIMGELQAMREEMTVFAYRQSDHSDRIEKLELKTFGKSFA
jgi:hypothetical protein